MKKLISLMSVLTLVVLLAACNGNENEDPDTTAPELEGVDNVSLFVDAETFSALEGVSATDDTDGDLTGEIQVIGADNVDESTPGLYTVRYKVEDAAGNLTQVARMVTVKKDQGPEIKGADNISALLGDVYRFDALEGVTVEDDRDEVTMDDLTVTGADTVDLATPGTYTVTYEISDDHDNTTTLERVITIDDGTVLLNGNYDEESWSVWSESNDLAWSVENGEAKVVVSTVGANDWSNQFQQLPFSVEADKDYKVTFKAKADVARPVTIKIEDPNNGYYTYANKIVDLTSSYQEFEVTFNDSLATDSAKFVFLLGNVVSDNGTAVTTNVYFDDIQLLVKNDNDEYVDAGILDNGTLEEPVDWTIAANDGAALDGKVNDGVLEVDVTNLGDNSYSAEIYQDELPFFNGKTYVVEFDIKADAASSILVALFETEGWTSLMGADGEKYQVDITDTTDFTHVSFEFEMTKDTLTNGKFAFEFGKLTDDNDAVISEATKYYIDNVSVYPKMENPLISVEDIVIEKGSTYDEYQGVSISDNQEDDLAVDVITVTGDTVDVNTSGVYEVILNGTDSDGNHAIEMTRTVTVVQFTDTEEVVNGDFSDNTDTVDNVADGTNSNWKEWHQNWGAVADVAMEIDSGVLNADISALGDAGQLWTIQLQQPGISIENGKVYKIVFDAKSSADRDINFVLKNANDHVYTSKQVSLTDTMTTIEYIFTVTEKTDSEMILAFEMGRADADTPETATVTFDNLKLYGSDFSYPDTEAPTLTAEDITLDLDSTFDPLEGVTVSDIRDIDLADDIEIVENNVDTSQEGDYTVKYKVTDTAGNITEVTRNVKVVEYVFNDSELVSNSDFTGDLSGWAFFTDGTDMSKEIVNEELVVTMNTKATGTDLWRGQLYYTPVNYELGKTYKLVFDVKADADTTINAVAGDQLTADPWFTTYVTEEIDVTTNYTTQEIMFTMTDDELTEGRVKFEIGAGNHNTLTFDNVKVLVAEAPDAE